MLRFFNYKTAVFYNWKIEHPIRFRREIRCFIIENFEGFLFYNWIPPVILQNRIRVYESSIMTQNLWLSFDKRNNTNRINKQSATFFVIEHVLRNTITLIQQSFSQTLKHDYDSLFMTQESFWIMLTSSTQCFRV